MTLAAHAAPPAPDVAAGQRTFAASCASCHQVGRAARSGFGPQLNGIVGRHTAADTGYKYSPALARANFAWTEQKLAAFIRKPGQVVPDNKMRFFALGFDDEKIGNLLAYLRTVPAPSPAPASK
jgi:cytochrome c